MICDSWSPSVHAHQSAAKKEPQNNPKKKKRKKTQMGKMITQMEQKHEIKEKKTFSPLSINLTAKSSLPLSTIGRDIGALKNFTAKNRIQGVKINKKLIGSCTVPRLSWRGPVAHHHCSDPWASLLEQCFTLPSSLQWLKGKNSQAAGDALRICSQSN